MQCLFLSSRGRHSVFLDYKFRCRPTSPALLVCCLDVVAHRSSFTMAVHHTSHHASAHSYDSTASDDTLINEEEQPFLSDDLEDAIKLNEVEDLVFRLLVKYKNIIK